MIRYTLLALALMGAAGVAHAQMYQRYDAARDPYGRPYVGSAPQPSPGDYTRETPGPQPMDQQAQAVSPYHGTMRHREAFRDEYGFRYDERGDRIDAYGRVISPHTTTP
ncbi:MAG: hypothetical protein JSS04_13550 [Proteobacteria bacterium]|nr:hypothetical protein [Pseudomonadota bacterium]